MARWGLLLWTYLLLLSIYSTVKHSWILWHSFISNLAVSISAENLLEPSISYPKALWHLHMYYVVCLCVCMFRSLGQKWMVLLQFFWFIVINILWIKNEIDFDNSKCNFIWKGITTLKIYIIGYFVFFMILYILCIDFMNFLY